MYEERDRESKKEREERIMVAVHPPDARGGSAAA